jgi:hypothetical protein
MPQTTGTFATPHAAKYLQQLCKHFAHKVEVQNTETEGTAALPVGPARMSATAERLIISIDVSSADQLDRAHMIIDSHLERFAFRENFTKMDWVTAE